MAFDLSKRAELFVDLGGAGAWPVGTRSQHLAVPVMGVFGSGSPGKVEPLTEFFRVLRKLTPVVS